MSLLHEWGLHYYSRYNATSMLFKQATGLIWEKFGVLLLSKSQKTSSVLENLSSPDYFQLHYVICPIVHRMGLAETLLALWDPDFLSQTSHISWDDIYEIMLLYCFCLIFEDWPQNFYSFLAHYLSRFIENSIGIFHRPIPTIFKDEFEDQLKSPAYNFMRRAVKQFLLNTFNSTQLIYDKSSPEVSNDLTLPDGIQLSIRYQKWLTRL